ncbi:hypothetical protein M758_UG308100 [Ceratodon purpureus]|nr:hypothetical protein M758_UG308100 [Ceratodon purpureus]
MLCEWYHLCLGFLSMLRTLAACPHFQPVHARCTLEIGRVNLSWIVALHYLNAANLFTMILSLVTNDFDLVWC